jgi:hypothetical protein
MDTISLGKSSIFTWLLLEEFISDPKLKIFRLLESRLMVVVKCSIVSEQFCLLYDTKHNITQNRRSSIEIFLDSINTKKSET